MPTNFANASYTGDATGMQTRTLGARATDVFNVRDFYVSGETEWLPAINRAMTASGAANGGIVFFPPGNYGISGPIVMPDDNASRKIIGSGGVADGNGTKISGNFADYLLVVQQNVNGSAPISAIDGIFFDQAFKKTKGAMTQVDSPIGPASLTGNGYGCLSLGLSFSRITNCTIRLGGGGVGIYYQGIENYIGSFAVIGQSDGATTAPECIGIWLENGRIECGKVMTCYQGIVPVTNSGIIVEGVNVERNRYGFWLAANPLAYFDRNASVPPPIRVNAANTIPPARAIIRNCGFDSHGSLSPPPDGGAFFYIASSGHIIENMKADSFGQGGLVPDHGVFLNNTSCILHRVDVSGTFKVAAIEIVGGSNTFITCSGTTSDALPVVGWKLPTAANSSRNSFIDCNLNGALPLSVVQGSLGTGESRPMEISDSVDPAWVLPSGPSYVGKPITGGGTYRVLGRWNGKVWTIAGGESGVLDGDPATMFLARTTELDGTHTTAYTTLINALVTAGLINASNGTSNYFDTLFISATKAPQANGLLSLLNGPPNATIVGTVTFTPDRGFSVVDGSSNNGIFTNADTAGGHWSDNAAHMSVWIADNPTSANAACGYLSTVSGDPEVAQIFPCLSSDGKAYYRINDRFGTQSAGITTATAQGHYLANRTGLDTQQGYKNGVDQSVVSIINSALPPGSNRFHTIVGATGLAFCASANVTALPAALTAGYPGQVAAFSSGGSLNSTQVTAFYNALQAYMTAIGVYRKMTTRLQDDNSVIDFIDSTTETQFFDNVGNATYGTVS